MKFAIRCWQPELAGQFYDLGAFHTRSDRTITELLEEMPFASNLKAAGYPMEFMADVKGHESFKLYLYGGAVDKILTLGQLAKQPTAKRIVSGD